MEESEKITFKVSRHIPDKEGYPKTKSYDVKYILGMTVLDGLIYIKENLDPSLTFRYSCRMASCGSCGMLINGVPSLACYTPIVELKTHEILLEPLPHLPIIKDLVVDEEELHRKYRAVKPYLVRQDVDEQNSPSTQYLQSEDEVEKYIQFTYCIKCGLCIAACPVFGRAEDFIGPLALGQAYRYLLDSRDNMREKRVELVSGEGGVWECTYVGECSSVCPKKVDPSFAIQKLKIEGGLHALKTLFSRGKRGNKVD